MPLLPREKCVKPHGSWPSGLITINMICAGNQAGGRKNICKGDSGGGLIVSKNTNDDTAEVIGIASSPWKSDMYNIVSVFPKKPPKLFDSSAHGHLTEFSIGIWYNLASKL